MYNIFLEIKKRRKENVTKWAISKYWINEPQSRVFGISTYNSRIVVICEYQKRPRGRLAGHNELINYYFWIFVYYRMDSKDVLQLTATIVIEISES